jgi:hypothetical protein
MVTFGWTETDAISFCLTDRRPLRKIHSIPTLMACVRDARGVTGRYLATGAVRPGREQHSASWLGALAYLVVLEQIGVNEHKKDQALRHHFVLGVAEGDSVIRLPRTPWNGDLTLRPTTHTATFIDLRALGDLTEAVLAKLRELHALGQLKIALAGGVHELVGRFAVNYRPS